MKNFKIIAIICTLLTMSGCSTYPSKFRCGDAKGLGCTMLSEIDKKITSGEIEEAYKDKKKTCRGRNCRSNKGEDVNTPKLKANHNTKMLTSSESDDAYEYSDGQYLYFKD